MLNFDNIKKQNTKVCDENENGARITESLFWKFRGVTKNNPVPTLPKPISTNLLRYFVTKNYIFFSKTENLHFKG